MSPDVHALTGAYVLDAVNDLERADFERHLRECDACDAEVRELRETAARLGQAAFDTPPPDLKSRVMAQIGQVRQLPPDTGSARMPSRNRWMLLVSSAAAAVFLVAAIVLGVLYVQESDVADETRALSSLVQADDARVISGGTANGGTTTLVVSIEQNRAAVLTTGMPKLPDGRVYQAWLIDLDGKATSAGLMEDGLLQVASLGNADTIGLTEEPAGGSQTPSMDPIIQLPV